MAVERTPHRISLLVGILTALAVLTMLLAFAACTVRGVEAMQNRPTGETATTQESSAIETIDGTNIASKTL